MKPKAFISSDWIADPIATALIRKGWDVVRGPRCGGKTTSGNQSEGLPAILRWYRSDRSHSPLATCDQQAMEMSPRLRAVFSIISRLQ